MAVAQPVRLHHLGRRSYVSQSGLASILKDLRESIDLQVPTARSSIKRSRDADPTAPRANTIYGPILRSMPVQLEEPSEDYSLNYAHPASMLAHCIHSCPAFGNRFLDLLTDTGCSPLAKWRVIVYCDEVSPGNALKHNNARKLQAIYWTVVEVGYAHLMTEYCWFTLATIRSSVVKRINGGLSCLMKLLLKTFYDDASNFNTGIILSVGDRRSILFAKLAILIADMDAIRSVWAIKGTSGTLGCLCCQNVVQFASQLHLFDASNSLVSAAETDTTKFKLKTDDSIAASAAHLMAQRDVLTQVQFKRLQQAFGINLCIEGLLLANIDGMRPISSTMFDYMHIYAVNGLFQLEAGLILQLIHADGITHHHVHAFVVSFVWPARVGGRSNPARNAFEKRTSIAGELKCSASEALSIFPVFRLFLMTMVMPTATDKVKQACESYFRLCAVLELLLGVPHGT